MWKITRHRHEEKKRKKPKEEFFMAIGHTYTVGRKGTIIFFSYT